MLWNSFISGRRNSVDNRSQSHLLLTPPSSPGLRNRPFSAGPTCLQVPGASPGYGLPDSKGDNSHRHSKSRSRSYSPFGNVTREKLPCGSPTFERVLCDMLSDTKLDGDKSDDEMTLQVRPVLKTRRNSKYKGTTRRVSIAPRATARKWTLMYILDVVINLRNIIRIKSISRLRMSAVLRRDHRSTNLQTKPKQESMCSVMH